MKGINGKWALIIGGAVIGLGLVIFMATYAVPRMLVTLTKAAPATKISLDASKVIGGKILAKADGKDKCKVNVFVMDDSGKGIKDKRVELTGMDTITPTEGETNVNGLVSFEMTSEVAGQFEVVAVVEGIELSKGTKVTFR